MIISFIACSKFPSFLIQHSSPLQDLHPCLGISIPLPNSLLSSKWINYHRFLRINFYHIWYYNSSSFYSSLSFFINYHFSLHVFNSSSNFNSDHNFSSSGYCQSCLELKILYVKSFVNFKFSYLVLSPLRQFVSMDADIDDEANNIEHIF